MHLLSSPFLIGPGKVLYSSFTVFFRGDRACDGVPGSTFRRRSMKQISLIIESNGSGKEKLDTLLKEGYKVVSVTANHGKSYNDFLVVLEKEED